MTSIPQSRWHRDTPPLEIQGCRWIGSGSSSIRTSGIASVNQLVVPVGVPLHFSLTSASVMNAFFIPQLGSMIYTMNGMTTQLNLRADAPGTFRGLSSHYQRRWFLRTCISRCMAVPAEQFTAWVEATRNTGPTLDAASYTRTGQAEHEYAAVHLRCRRSPPLPSDRHAETAARTWPADGAAQRERIAADGALACWAS